MPLIAKRYAEALIGISEDKNAIDSHQQALQEISKLYENVEGLRLFLTNPQISLPVKKDTLERLFSERLHDEVLNFLMVILKKGRIKYLPAILKEYVRLADQKRKILPVTVFSPEVLAEDHLNRIKKGYGRIYKASSVKLEVRIDKTLVGGIKIHIADRVADGSVKGRLAGLKAFLLKS